jgi:SH3 domain protein
MRVARWLCRVILVAAARGPRRLLDGEVRAHLRSGPGLEFRILRILPSGAVVQTLGRDADWVHVRHGDLEGWVPSDNVSNSEPATLALPRVREKLVGAEGRISELDKKLVEQTAQLEELASLRERNRVLESDASRASATARWKSLTAGAGIVLVGILIGLIAPRGGGTRSRLKL